MSEHDIVQQMISALGQSQGQRLPAELDPHFVDIDERTPEDQLMFAKAFAKLVRYYKVDEAGPVPDGDWQAFFPYTREQARALLQQQDGKLPAHLALLATFVKLHEAPREAINRLTGEHLKLFYERVLGFEPRGAIADRAHVIVELKKLASATRIGAEHSFSAGKDPTGVERVYRPVRDTIVSLAQVESLRAVYVDPRGGGTVRFAPVASSSDGLGGALPEPEPKWHAFGSPALPAAEIGFAIASPVLRMARSDRKIALQLTVRGLDPAVHTETALAASFQALLTGEKGWMAVRVAAVSVLGSDRIGFELNVPRSEGAVVDYDAALHEQPFAAQEPVLQLVLKPEAALPYSALKSLVVRRARLRVEVSRLPVTAADNDSGPVDPKKAFLPFGAQPMVGSRFRVSCPEALSKQLDELSLKIDWLDPPASFANHYSQYCAQDTSAPVPGNGYFKGSVAFSDAGSWELSQEASLFDAQPSQRVLRFTPDTGSKRKEDAGHAYRTLAATSTHWSRMQAQREAHKRPRSKSAHAAFPPEPDASQGFITLQLERDFLHSAYRHWTIHNALNGIKVALPEPYTPTVRNLEVSYKAASDDVSLHSPTLQSFGVTDIRFFHVGCFGAMREHAYQREQFAFVPDKRVPLLPGHEAEGELLIGLRDLAAGDSVSLLFQVADGSADPELPREKLTWSVLCDNYWKVLGSSELVLDTTQHLLVSGSVCVVLPAETTSDNTILPEGLVWLKASVQRNVAAVCQLITVQANAVELRFEDHGNDPNHLATPLPKSSIAKLKTPIATVKSVKQPFASFGGRAREASSALHMRAAERLRHKQRCVSAWDYERVVLDAFPSVHKAKCIPHAKDGQWLAPGHVLLVVVPDLRNANAKDPLQPKVDAATLDAIETHVRARAGMYAEQALCVQVRNPRYQRVRADFGVRFHDGFESNFYAKLLEQELLRFLSPWAYDSVLSPEFGGRVYKSVLLNFVEERPYVDYVTDFKLFSSADELLELHDLNEARAATPDAILVSDATHTVRPVQR